MAALEGLAVLKGLGTASANAVARKHFPDAFGLDLRNGSALGMFVNDKDVAIAIGAGEQNDGVMGVSIIHGGKPFDGASIIEVFDDVNATPEAGEELTSGDVPIAMEPGAFLPAAEAFEAEFVLRICENIISDGSGNEPGIGFGFCMVRRDEFGAIPGVADAAGIGSGIDAGPPVLFGGTQAGRDVGVFATGERGSLLDADEVVFEAEVSIDITFIMEMAGDDSGTIFEPEDPPGRNEGMVETPKSATADVIEVFEIGFADFSNEEAFEARIALAIIGADLRKEPMGFTAAASAAVTDEGGTFGIVTEAGGSAGLELTGVEADPSAGEVDELIVRTAKALAKRSVGDIKRGAAHNEKRSASTDEPKRHR